MKTVVLDASALLALLFNEPGADAVAKMLPRVVLSAVTYAEVLIRCVDRGKSLEDAVRLLNRLRLPVVPFGAELASGAASVCPETKPLELSLGDRSSLALAAARKIPVVTANREWKHLKMGVSVKCVG